MPSGGKELRTVLTEFPFPASFTAGGDEWRTVKTSGYPVSELLRADLVVVNQDLRIALKAKLLGRKVVIVDIILRPPTSAPRHRLLRTALDRIDFFIHYFRDLSGYSRLYGIGPERSGYVPFKPNLRDRFGPAASEGGYVTIFGQSCRDYDVYFSAVRGLEAVMPFRDPAVLREHGSLITQVPEWIEVLENDGSQEAVHRILSGAKLVVIPIRPDNICSSSIGTYLNAMWLGKACVLTEGPGVSDVLTDEALVVPAGDPGALRDAVERLLRDDDLRAAYAERGRRYAESLGGVAELSLRVKDEVMRWYYSARGPARA